MANRKCQLTMPYQRYKNVICFVLIFFLFVSFCGRPEHAARCEVYFYTSVMKYCQAMRPEKKKTPLSAGLMEVSPYFMSFPQLSVGINLTRDESCFSSSSLYFPS